MPVDEQMLKQLKLMFLQTHSVCPPDLPVHGVDPGRNEFSLQTITGGNRQKTMKLIANPRHELGSFTFEPGGSLSIQWLPWLSHSIVGMAVDANPDIFVTAAINGCSVFVTGAPANPTVYHAGIGTDLKAGTYIITHGQENDATEKKLKAAADASDAPLFWRLLLEKHVPGATTDANFAEVNKTHYIKDGSTGTLLGNKATKRAAAFEKAFTTRNKEWPSKTDPMKLMMMFAWGSVVGFKSGTWKFYLQENVSIRYSNKAGTSKFAVSIPIALTQFYPKGQERTNLITDPNMVITQPYTASQFVAAWR